MMNRPLKPYGRREEECIVRECRNTHTHTYTQMNITGPERERDFFNPGLGWGRGKTMFTGLFSHVHLGDVDPHVLPPVRKLAPGRLELLACRTPRGKAERRNHRPPLTVRKRRTKAYEEQSMSV